MDDAELHNLKRLAVAFHGAMEQTDLDECNLNLHDFPVECCHHASNLLSVFLFSHGLRQIEQVTGNRPDKPDGCHVWIEVNGFVVDITAYQFTDINEKVIVEKDSPWHSALQGKVSGLGRDDEPLEDSLSRVKNYYNEHHASLYTRLESTALKLLSQ